MPKIVILVYKFVQNLGLPSSVRIEAWYIVLNMMRNRIRLEIVLIVIFSEKTGRSIVIVVRHRHWSHGRINSGCLMITN